MAGSCMVFRLIYFSAVIGSVPACRYCIKPLPYDLIQYRTASLFERQEVRFFWKHGNMLTLVYSPKQSFDGGGQSECLAVFPFLLYLQHRFDYLNVMISFGSRYNLSRIFFGGFFIRGHPYTMETISFAIRFWSKVGVQDAHSWQIMQVICESFKITD